MRRVLFVPRWTILAAVGAALLVRAQTTVTTPTPDNSNPKNNITDDTVCSPASDTNQNCANDGGSGSSTRIDDSKDININIHINIHNNHGYEPPDVEWCRRRPTWRITTKEKNGEPEEEESNDTDARDRCQRVLGYEPDPEALTRNMNLEELHHHMLSSTYDSRDERSDPEPEDDETFNELPVLERPLFRDLVACMGETLVKSSHDRSTTGTMKNARISNLYRNKNGTAMMAVVEDALTEEEAEAVMALSHCEKRLVPAVFEKRRFVDGGGNDCLYLTGFLQLLVPGVAYRILRTAQMVWQTAGWNDSKKQFVPIDIDSEYLRKLRETGKLKLEESKTDDDDDDDDGQPPQSAYSTRWFPDPVSETGIRTSEHLAYDRFRTLSYHDDSGSDYTVLVALSNPEDYEGGYFSLCPEFPNEKCEENKISIKPKRLSAIVFLSDSEHGVQDILSKGRVMMANELWRYGDAPATTMRPEVAEFVMGIDDDDLYKYEDEKGDEDEDDEEEDDDLYETDV
jgi:hypothetical protein